MSIFMKLFGSKELLAGLSKASVQAPIMLNVRLRSSAEKIMARSLELVPVQTGNLRDSHFIEKDGNDGYNLGYTADYALSVHELPLSHTPPTQWKYLETPFLEESGVVEKAYSDLDIWAGISFWNML